MSVLQRHWRTLLLAMAAISMANGLLMILFTGLWYECISNPARLALYNRHFIIDVGCAYLAVGGGLLWAARDAAAARPLIGVALVFNALHVCNHLLEYAQGAIPTRHWSIELVGVFVPTLLLALLLRTAPRAGD